MGGRGSDSGCVFFWFELSRARPRTGQAADRQTPRPAMDSVPECSWCRRGILSAGRCGKEIRYVIDFYNGDTGGTNKGDAVRASPCPRGAVLVLAAVREVNAAPPRAR